MTGILNPPVLAYWPRLQATFFTRWGDNRRAEVLSSQRSIQQRGDWQPALAAVLAGMDVEFSASWGIL
jgi:hypothetical protein